MPPKKNKKRTPRTRNNRTPRTSQEPEPTVEDEGAAGGAHQFPDGFFDNLVYHSFVDHMEFGLMEVKVHEDAATFNMQTELFGNADLPKLWWYYHDRDYRPDKSSVYIRKLLENCTFYRESHADIIQGIETPFMERWEHSYQPFLDYLTQSEIQVHEEYLRHLEDPRHPAHLLTQRLDTMDGVVGRGHAYQRHCNLTRRESFEKMYYKKAQGMFPHPCLAGHGIALAILVAIPFLLERMQSEAISRDGAAREVLIQAQDECIREADAAEARGDVERMQHYRRMAVVLENIEIYADNRLRLAVTIEMNGEFHVDNTGITEKRLFGQVTSRSQNGVIAQMDCNAMAVIFALEPREINDGRYPLTMLVPFILSAYPTNKLVNEFSTLAGDREVEQFLHDHWEDVNATVVVPGLVPVEE